MMGVWVVGGSVIKIPSWLETVLWVLNDALCPVVIVYASRVRPVARGLRVEC